MTDDELDRIVAEQVMGWHQGEVTGILPDVWLGGGGYWYLVGDWHPSTSIAQAWQVAERLRALGWRWYGEMGAAGAWVLFDRGPAWSDRYGEAETMPRAICLAALRAIGD